MNAHTINLAREWAWSFFKEDTTGHDGWHMERVAANARYIAEKEEADALHCELAAWLHDIADDKFYMREGEGMERVEGWLQSQGFQNSETNALLHSIERVSFKAGTNRPPETLEAKVVQDADRLDALGAIGVARTFMYAGSHRHKMYDPVKESKDAIEHFYEKLLQLKNLMHTETAKRSANERHQFMEQFLEQFYREWN
ncbi:HD domain-containing protein [Salsuginibacillus kocurii]|uniref:HD domain-containing protein n=1 Tax=Salsuginibacillus kocurii TaxID=427078 RepID=UPI0003644F49|nr:HD domain-containing protein [Salsuginibacillus kocurii]